MNVGVATITGLALIIGGWLYLHRDAPKTTTLLFLIAGIGIGGWIGATLGDWISTALGMVGTQTATWVGIGTSTLVAGLAIVATLEIVIKGLWKKKAKPRRWHPWLALALPTIIAAASVPILVEIVNAFTSAVTQVGATFNGQLGG